MPGFTPARAGLIAAATALAAAGLVAGPAPESAADCTYVFPDQFIVNQDNGYRVEMKGAGSTVYGTASSFNNRQDLVNTGTVSGGANGKRVDFTIDWSDGRQGRYVGDVLGDLRVSGATQDNVTGGTAQWNSVTKVTCLNIVEAAPAPAPASAPAPAPAAPAPAAPAPPPEKKPLQGPTVSAKPGLTGVTFTFTDRSGVASQCTYSSEGFTDSFALPANGSTDLFVAAIRQFRTRTGTVSCDNGTSSPTSVEF